MVLGTPRYMAPEQIDGRPADERTDIFAFGLVLYEMLTGQHAFEGKSAASVMAAILDREPVPISALKPLTPPALEQVVVTCLAKDPAESWQSVRELKHALAWAGGRGRSSAMVAARPGRSLSSPRHLQDRERVHSGPSPRTEPTKAPPSGSRSLCPRRPGSAGRSRSPSRRTAAHRVLAAPPGQGPQLFVRALDALTLTPVPGGEGGAVPFWSADGRQIAFLVCRRSPPEGRLSGGPAQTLCKIGSRGRSDLEART